MAGRKLTLSPLLFSVTFITLWTLAPTSHARKNISSWLREAQGPPRLDSRWAYPALQVTEASAGVWCSDKSEVAQSCWTLCDPMDCSLPGSAIHGIFQARALEWGAISFSRRCSWPRNPGLPHGRHCRQTIYCLSHQGKYTNSRKLERIFSDSLFEASFTLTV